jgi:ABC-type Fe3+/spermidine/putrescine transport system ATPase subunit
VRLSGLEERKPAQLSGGQQQRVALARALIKRPKVLLLDEPLSALDRKLRGEMQLELVRLQHEVGITFVLVTHDQDEALSMADRIAVMDRGRVLQVAPPQELYERPNCRMVAGFIGTMNLLPGRVVGRGEGRVRIEAQGVGRVELPSTGESGGAIDLAVRPENVRLLREPPACGLIAVPGKIAQIAYFGDSSRVFVEAEGGLRLTCQQSGPARRDGPPLAVGEPCFAAFAPADCILLHA